jgi:hypothetical protein
MISTPGINRLSAYKEIFVYLVAKFGRKTQEARWHFSDCDPVNVR